MFASNVTAERQLLGAVLRDPARLPQLLDVKPEDFHSTEHGALWGLLLDMHREGVRIDCTTTVPSHIAHNSSPERFGGLAYVLELPDVVPATANARHYATTIRELASQRKLQGMISEWAELAQDNIKARRAMDTILRDIGQLTWPDQVAVDTRLGAVLERALAKAEASRSLGAGMAIPWPWPKLQAILGGTMPGEVCIVAARPSIGKTAVAQDLAKSIAARHIHGSVLVYNFEGTAESIGLRHLLTRAGVSSKALRNGDLTDGQMDRLRLAAAQLTTTAASEMLNIIQATGWTIEKVEADIIRRQETAEEPVGLVVIDYLQLVRPGDLKVPREQQVARMSAGCMRIATREGEELPVVALSQLNRDLEKRGDKRPILADLRESGSLEQDASQVVFVHREIDSSDERSLPGPSELIVAKNRDGETGTADVWFERGHFYNDAQEVA